MQCFSLGEESDPWSNTEPQHGGHGKNRVLDPGGVKPCRLMSYSLCPVQSIEGSCEDIG